MRGALWWLLGTSEAAIRVDQTHQCMLVVLACAARGETKLSAVQEALKISVERYL